MFFDRISLSVCAKAQTELAKEKAVYEMFIDEHIISPLQTLVEVCFLVFSGILLDKTTSHD